MTTDTGEILTIEKGTTNITAPTLGNKTVNGFYAVAEVTTL